MSLPVIRVACLLGGALDWKAAPEGTLASGDPPNV